MMQEQNFPGRVGLQQRVVPTYRADFFDCLAQACAGGLEVIAGQPLAQEGIVTARELQYARLVPAHNRHFMDPASPFYLCWQIGLLRWLAEWQPDVLVVEANPRYPATRLAIQWMHRRQRPVIGWGLGAPALSGRQAVFRQWERLSLLRSLDAVVAYSRRGAQEYRSLGLPAERVFVAPNATARRPSLPPPQRPDEFTGHPVVLFVGRLQARKRIDLLLQACAALPPALQPRLLIVGDGPARPVFESMAGAVYPQAEFIGARHGAELAPYFTAADLFVLPGTGGLAVQEAMAHALPVVVARGDGTQDDLVGQGNGWQITPDSLQALSEALQQALSDPARLRRMGQESYRIVSQDANVEAMVEVFVSALDSVSRKL
ncbi:MAG: glycosyltransferase [Anaerolineales bacterium]|nr:glycosyltransferase [Anaerolineales bacterium]